MFNLNDKASFKVSDRYPVTADYKGDDYIIVTSTIIGSCTNSVGTDYYLMSIDEGVYCIAIKFSAREAESVKEYNSKFVPNIENYFGQKVIWIPTQDVFESQKTVIVCDGSTCTNCKEYVRMAAPNQEDGISFVCYSCRQNKWR